MKSDHPLTGAASHPPATAFSRLVRGEASAAEAREIVRHMLAGCATCARAAEGARASLAPPPTAGRDEIDADYGDVFRRVGEKLAGRLDLRRREQATAQELYVELLGLEAVEGLVQVQSTRRYSSLALCELLLEKSRDLAVEDPAAAHKAAQFAVAVAEQLDLELYGAPVVQDLRAIAWAYFANVRRAQADLRSAEISLELAEELLEQGSGDPLARAELLTLRASLLAYCGRFAAAVGLLNRAVSLYRRSGERHLLGRTLVKKGTVLGNAGEAIGAVRLIRRGIDLIEPQREPRLMVSATHNLIWFLHESGSTGQADACRDAARRLYEAAGDRPQLCRLRWLEGKLAPGLAQAEEALSQAREGLAREGLSYEAALAAMDLAVLYAGQRKGDEMRREANEMLPLFRTGDMYRETMIALSSFQQGGTRCDTAELLASLGGFIQRSRQAKNPAALAELVSQAVPAGSPDKTPARSDKPAPPAVR